MNFKLTPLAAIVVAVVSFNAVAADPVKDGWTVAAYGMSNYRLVDSASTNTEFGKPDYRTVGTFNKSANQVEATVTKKFQFENNVYSDFVVRAEYGNGDSYYYSSSGGEHDGTTVDGRYYPSHGQFEVKESYVVLGNLPYFGGDSQVWAGRRFLNRSSSLLSGEFWKQSSGVGAGYEKAFTASGTRAGVALVSADPDKAADETGNDRTTISSLDMYYYGVKGLGGSFDFDLKLMKRAHTEDIDNKSTDQGLGGAITYNTNYYGLDGWTQTGVGYGSGLATNRGVNFGSWSYGGFNKESKGLFVTSYGVANINDNWQFGSEVTYWAPKNVNWAEPGVAVDVERILLAVRPSYKVNTNLRIEFTGGLAQENLKNTTWGRSDDSTNFYSAELAPVFTVNADYFGRPQIKPYVAYVATDDEKAASSIGIDSSSGAKDQVLFGVQAEIWF